MAHRKRQITLMIKLLPKSIHRWLRNDGLGLAAAVSFYSIFAMVPLAVLVVTIATEILGKMNPEGAVRRSLTKAFPSSNLDQFFDALNANAIGYAAAGGLSLTSLLMLLWAASGVFSRLQFSVRRIFEEPSETILGLLGLSVLRKARVLVLTFVAGLILAVGSVATSLCIPIHNNLHLHSSVLLELFLAIFIAIGGGVLIASSLRKKPPLRPVIISSFLFFVTLLAGRILVSQYIAHSSLSAAYGIASSVVIVLIWIYFASICFGISVAFCAEIADRKSDSKPVKSDG